MRSDAAAVIRPMKECLTLFWMTGRVSFPAMLLDLYDVADHRLPALDLTLVLTGDATPKIIAAIPLEPAMGIILIDPTLRAPHRKRLACIDSEIIELIFLFSIR